MSILIIGVNGFIGSELAKEALRLASHKLPIKTKFVYTESH